VFDVAPDCPRRAVRLEEDLGPLADLPAFVAVLVAPFDRLDQVGEAALDGNVAEPGLGPLGTAPAPQVPRSRARARSVSWCWLRSRMLTQLAGMGPDTKHATAFWKNFRCGSDVLASLIYTCEVRRADPFHYLPEVSATRINSPRIPNAGSPGTAAGRSRPSPRRPLPPADPDCFTSLATAIPSRRRRLCKRAGKTRQKDKRQCPSRRCQPPLRAGEALVRAGFTPQAQPPSGARWRSRPRAPKESRAGTAAMKATY
jgi:hypothetical protein